MKTETDRSTLVPGLYAARTFVNGWRILEWADGAWWYPTKVSRWMAPDPSEWVGPLPAEGQKGAEIPEQVFDL